MEPLLPDRHPNLDFFLCDVMDAIPKSDLTSMEHPIFSLATRPDLRIQHYEHNGNTIDIVPSVKGIATIHDKDILIYCISQLIAKMNEGVTPSKRLHMKAYDLLAMTNRETSGNGYRRLRDTLERLSGTRITTDIRTNGKRIQSGFGLIDSWNIIEKDAETERMVALEVVLSDWLFNAVLGHEVLTLSRDYFRLRKPLERRVYELARKHCGAQQQWAIGLATLRKKCGSKGSLREFRRMLRTLVEHDHLPDYSVALEPHDKVVFINRNFSFLPLLTHTPPLRTETYEKAKKLASGLDIYVLEREWREWSANKPAPDSADAAFIAFCKRKAQEYR